MSTEIDEKVLVVREMNLTELSEAHYKTQQKVDIIEAAVKELKADTEEIVEWLRGARVGVKFLLAIATTIGRFIIWITTAIGAMTVLIQTVRSLFPGLKISDTFKINLQ